MLRPDDGRRLTWTEGPDGALVVTLDGCAAVVEPDPEGGHRVALYTHGALDRGDPPLLTQTVATRREAKMRAGYLLLGPGSPAAPGRRLTRREALVALEWAERLVKRVQSAEGFWDAALERPELLDDSSRWAEVLESARSELLEGKRQPEGAAAVAEGVTREAAPLAARLAPEGQGER